MSRFLKRLPEGRASGRTLPSLGKRILPALVAAFVALTLPHAAQAYMPRYVHVTLGVPWVAYLIFLLGILTPVFLYLGIAWYWRHELEAAPGGKDDKDEE